MKLHLLVEGWERASSIRDDIQSGKYSLAYIARVHGVSRPYVSAIARRMGLSRGVKPVRPHAGIRPAPLLKNLPSLGVQR